MNNTDDYLNRLKLEDYIFIIFIVVSILNIYGNNLLKKTVIYNDNNYKKNADEIFLIVVIITTILYIYFFKRNYDIYKKNKSNKLIIKVVGSFLVLIGSICLLIFQLSDSNTSLTPSI